jgi:hypothetical protein
MTSIKKPQRRAPPDATAMAGVFVTIFGIGFAALPAILAVKEPLSEPWFAILLVFSIVLTLAGGAGAIYWLREAWVHPRDRIPPPAGWVPRQLIWFPPLLVTAFILTLWSAANGSKGNEIPGTLALTMSTVGLVATALLFCISRKQSEPPIKRLQLGVALFAAISLGACGGFFYWAVIHKTDIPVTDRVAVSGGRGMQNGGQATIQIPGTPPQRRHFALIMTLTNTAQVGDCVNPARLDVTPVIDGEQRQPVSLRPGHEARLDLTGATHQASVIVTLHVQDPFCAVNLGVNQAVLYN